jgi:hypothetical protein
MSLNIKNREAHQIAHELSKLTGESMTTAVTIALRERRDVRADRYPARRSCARAIENSAVRRMSAANFVEAAVLIDASRDPIASRRFDDLIKEAQIIIEPVTEPQA